MKGKGGMPRMYGPVENRVYVSNLPWNIAWQELKDHMKTVGDVVYADLFTEAGRSRGCALVSFRSPEDAQRAVMELHDTDLGGRKIIVREDRVDQSTPSKECRVYVGNLSWQATWRDLKDHCRAVGEVRRADVAGDLDGNPKGYGIVEFASPEEAQAAVEQLTGTDLLGREIFVREDREHSRATLSWDTLVGNSCGVLRDTLAWRSCRRVTCATKASRGASSYGGYGYNEQGPYTKVFVGNLPYSVTWQQLKDEMRQVGEVQHVELFTENAEPHGRSKGCAVVEFATFGAAKRAVQYLHDTMLQGRYMYVREYYEGARREGWDAGRQFPKFRVKATEAQ
ncbi:unnamed protein product [Durusdinium trenchii]|uniref:RRM domain-containing protein n=1 Tax=Durusdinium trenchii TaxID=1381693 RepID=A0ABP0L2N9_9DINO